MNRILLILGVFAFLGGSKLSANTIIKPKIDWVALDEIAGNNISDPNTYQLRPKKKAVAVVLAVTLGAFGVHRLYLGTSNKVPIIYTLTLGGGFGVLMVSDIAAIIAAKDINTYSPSEKVFMWAK